MGKKRRYHQIGRTIVRLAVARELDGPYYLADYLKKWAEENNYPGRVPHRNTISDYWNGKARPSEEIVYLLTDALQLTESEKAELAWVYTFPFPVAA